MGYGPVELAGDLVSGGWDAIANITSGIGKGAESLISPFFPSPQKQTPTVSQIVEPMGATGQTFRPTDPENPSMVETQKMYAGDNFLSSQYAERFNAPAKVAESKELSASISKKDSDWLGGGLDWALAQSKKIATVADEFMKTWDLEPRKSISEGPKETGNSPGTVTHMQQDVDKRVGTIRATGSKLLEQVKGLFSIGFEGPTGDQPAHQTKTGAEYFPEPKTTLGIAVAVVIVALLLLRK